jgi:hypothetical protein
MNVKMHFLLSYFLTLLVKRGKVPSYTGLKSPMYQPQMIDDSNEGFGRTKTDRKTKVLEKNLLQSHSVCQ